MCAQYYPGMATHKGINVFAKPVWSAHKLRMFNWTGTSNVLVHGLTLREPTFWGYQ